MVWACGENERNRGIHTITIYTRLTGKITTHSKKTMVRQCKWLFGADRERDVDGARGRAVRRNRISIVATADWRVYVLQDAIYSSCCLFDPQCHTLPNITRTCSSHVNVDDGRSVLERLLQPEALQRHLTRVAVELLRCHHARFLLQSLDHNRWQLVRVRRFTFACKRIIMLTT